MSIERLEALDHDRLPKPWERLPTAIFNSQWLEPLYEEILALCSYWEEIPVETQGGIERLWRQLGVASIAKLMSDNPRLFSFQYRKEPLHQEYHLGHEIGDIESASTLVDEGGKKWGASGVSVVLTDVGNAAFIRSPDDDMLLDRELELNTNDAEMELHLQTQIEIWACTMPDDWVELFENRVLKRANVSEHQPHHYFKQLLSKKDFAHVEREFLSFLTQPAHNKEAEIQVLHKPVRRL